MRKWLLVFSILLMLLLAACSGAEADTSLADADVSKPETPTEVVETPKEEVVQPDPTTTSAPTEEVVYDGLQMECTLVSNQQEAPTELVSILSVKENDWVSGPETAAVTIVEYSDFQ